MDMSDRVVVVMAGGRGQRLWPLSTEARPKQFLDLERRGRTLLQTTVDRVGLLAGGPERTLVSTVAPYMPLVREQLPDVPEANLLVQPEGKDSAPAIALAALHVQARFGDVPMGIFATDHVIEDGAAFERALGRAFELATSRRGLVVVGIRPTRPATGYGYIKRGSPALDGFRVARFVEKPDRDRAQDYLDSDAYLWNAGMLVSTVDTILTELDRHAPELMTPLREAFGGDRLARAFAELEAASIDYAVMEKTDAAYVVEGDFGWDDIGDWAALERLLPRQDGVVHTVFGAHAGHDASGNIVYTDGPDDVLVAYGVENLVIVKRGDTVLIVPKDRAAEIKTLLEDERLRELVP
jgi:mannose-1-phosphate guanylyltransferase